jgi:hypothetical protein
MQLRGISSGNPQARPEDGDGDRRDRDFPWRAWLGVDAMKRHIIIEEVSPQRVLFQFAVQAVIRVTVGALAAKWL